MFSVGNGGGDGDRGDRGQAMPLAAAMVGLTAVLMLAFVPVGTALDRRTQARTAADAAALAGAASGSRADAGRLASANGGELVDFSRRGDRVVVEVRVGDMTAHASARATGGAGLLSSPAGRGGPGGRANVPGGLVTVACPTGGTVSVAGSIARAVRGLLERAGERGLPLCGWGYRGPEQQIRLRREHCGTSRYAVYEMPASRCRPPTARPGTSMHERGLAIDFTCAGRTVAAGQACHAFLGAVADDFGLHNLPSEPWHWSVNGQ
jgi:hypothetical protein